MTNKEALAAKIVATVPDNTLEVALIDGAIDPNGTYTAADAKDIELVAIEVLYSLFTSQDVSEGGYSVSHPDFLRKVKERLLYYARKYDRTDIIDAVDPKPSIKGVSPW
jgi:hypothetical protein